MNLEHQKDFYNQYWKDYSTWGAYKIQRVITIMNLLLSVRKNVSKEPNVLDLGCGDGRLASIWREIIGGNIYALDLSPEAMQKAKTRYPFINFTDGDATQTPYDADFFDVVVNQEVMEHIEDQQKFVFECNRILKKNGYLILTTPNKYYFDHKEGGNYSKQPIENIVTKEELAALVNPYFKIHSLETIIFAKGDYGKYRLFTNRYLLGVLNKIGIKQSWINYLLRKGYGIHLVLVAQKK